MILLSRQWTPLSPKERIAYISMLQKLVLVEKPVTWGEVKEGQNGVEKMC